MPYLLETDFADIRHGKAKTAAVNGNHFAIGIDHEHAKGIVAAPADENLRAAVIGREIVQSRAMGVDRHPERIFRFRNFAQLGGQCFQVNPSGVRFENIGRGRVQITVKEQIVTLRLRRGDEIVVHQPDMLERQAAHIPQEFSERSHIPLGYGAEHRNLRFARFRRDGLDAGYCASVTARTPADTVVNGFGPVQRNLKAIAATRRQFVSTARQQQAVGGDRRAKTATPRIVQCFAQGRPRQGFGVSKAEMSAWPGCCNVVGNAAEQFQWHGTVLCAHQVSAEIGFAVAGAHIAHDATQIAEIIDPKNDMGRVENKMAGQKPLV